MESNNMNPLTQDLSIFQKFNFEKQPVAVKFLYRKPEGIKKIGKHMAICEMIREAQDSTEPFYMTGEDEDCFGAVTLGMKGTPPFAEAGLVGHGLGIFKEPRANARLYNYLPKVHPGVINYVVFSPLDKLTFEPDMLFIGASISKAEILFRAIDHLSGGPRESKTTGVFGCAWLFTYPYQTGKINYTITGLAYGAKSKQVFPEGMILFAIPFDWIPVLIHNLKEIDWDLPSYKMGVKKFKEFEGQVIGNLAKEMEESAGS
jgi:uncharacterized protein (DUF169 family)